MEYCVICIGTVPHVKLVSYVFSITIQLKCFFRNCPSNFSNVPAVNFDEWDRMSPLYPDLDRSLLGVKFPGKNAMNA